VRFILLSMNDSGELKSLIMSNRLNVKSKQETVNNIAYDWTSKLGCLGC